MARAYTTHKLGPRRSLTPEGFLICHDVPVASIGELIYGRGEVPLQTGDDGFIRVTRTADDLFSDITLSSCEGKPVTFKHPPGLKVTADNYATVMRGHMSNARRGTGSDDDVILADLTIFDRTTIDAITSGQAEEVSIGYEASYTQDAPGRGRQTKIVVNHVAVVPKGRCGPRCAIGDEELNMNWFEKLKAAMAEKIRTGDADGAAALITQAEAERDAELAAAAKPTGDTQTVTLDAATLSIITKLGERVEAIEAGINAKATADAEAAAAAEKAKEQAATADAELVTLYPASRAQDIASKAEILAPGFTMPTVDATATADCAAALCGCQRAVLAKSYAGDGKTAIDIILAGRTLDTEGMDAPTIDGIFNAAAAVRAMQNNALTTGNKPQGYKPPLNPIERMKQGIAKVHNTKAA